MTRAFLLATAALLLLIVLGACGADGQEESTPTAAPVEEATEASAQPTASYPAPPTSDAYPPPPPPPTPDTSYPDDQVWVVAPAGQQCEEPRFANSAEAVAALEDAGIEVFSLEEEGRMVCEACGCPTSLHFRARIGVEDLSAAQELGWLRE